MRKLSGTGAAAIVSTVAGTPRGWTSPANATLYNISFNGPALSARFGSDGPNGLVLSGSRLYIADTGEG